MMSSVSRAAEPPVIPPYTSYVPLLAKTFEFLDLIDCVASNHAAVSRAWCAAMQQRSKDKMAIINLWRTLKANPIPFARKKIVHSGDDLTNTVNFYIGPFWTRYFNFPPYACTIVPSRSPERCISFLPDDVFPGSNPGRLEPNPALRIRAIGGSWRLRDLSTRLNQFVLVNGDTRIVVNVKAACDAACNTFGRSDDDQKPIVQARYFSNLNRLLIVTQSGWMAVWEIIAGTARLINGGYIGHNFEVHQVIFVGSTAFIEAQTNDQRGWFSAFDCEIMKWTDFSHLGSFYEATPLRDKLLLWGRGEVGEVCCLIRAETGWVKDENSAFRVKKLKSFVTLYSSPPSESLAMLCGEYTQAKETEKAEDEKWEETCVIIDHVRMKNLKTKKELIEKARNLNFPKILGDHLVTLENMKVGYRVCLFDRYGTLKKTILLPSDESLENSISCEPHIAPNGSALFVVDNFNYFLKDEIVLSLYGKPEAFAREEAKVSSGSVAASAAAE